MPTAAHQDYGIFHYFRFSVICKGNHGYLLWTEYGCRKKDRIRTGIRQALLITRIWSIGMMLLELYNCTKTDQCVTGSQRPPVLSNYLLHVLERPILSFILHLLFSVFKKRASGGMGDHITPCLFQYDRIDWKNHRCPGSCSHFSITGASLYGLKPIVVWILMVIPTYYKGQESCCDICHRAFSSYFMLYPMRRRDLR